MQRGKEMANLLDLLSFKDLPPSSFISYCGPFDDKLPKQKLLNATLTASGGRSNTWSTNINVSHAIQKFVHCLNRKFLCILITLLKFVILGYRLITL